MNKEQKTLILHELEANVEAYQKAQKRVGPQAKEKLNERIIPLIDIINQLKEELK